MAFGSIPIPCVKVCCGPRCGAHPGHHAIYKTMEKQSALPVVPILCQGRCGDGVTVIAANGDPHKIRDTAEARRFQNEII